MEKSKKEKMPEGLGPRVAASILIFFGWLCFLLIYIVFWSAPYGIFESLVIVIVTLMMMLAIMAAVWASWGIKYAAQNADISECIGKEIEKEIEKKVEEHMKGLEKKGK